MYTKTCPFCGGKIPKSKIQEFESKFKAEESKIKIRVEEDFKRLLKEEKQRAEKALNQQIRTYSPNVSSAG